MPDKCREATDNSKHQVDCLYRVFGRDHLVVDGELDCEDRRVVPDRRTVLKCCLVAFFVDISYIHTVGGDLVEHGIG